MKKMIATALCTAMCSYAFAQAGNVGIGTTLPTAKLQVHHTNALASPALTLFDSSAGSGSRIRFAKQGISSQFHVVSTLTATSAANSLDFLQGSTSLMFLQGDGKLGINDNTPIAALDVNGDANLQGKILLNGNAGTTGQVLVSKGAGADPEWSNATAGTGGKIAFTYNNNSSSAGRFGFNKTTGSIQSDSLDYSNVLYNIGSDFSINTVGLTDNFITINTTGQYHFEGMIRFLATNVNSALPRAGIKLRYDPPATAFSEFYVRAEEVLSEFNNAGTGGTNHDLSTGIPFSFDFYFVAGTTLTFMTELLPNNFPYLVLGVSAGGYVKGYKVSD
ncbi:MAG: hypothetical protein V4722_26260 [Bacteroidota bacterium]